MELMHTAARHAYTIPRQIGPMAGGLARFLGDNSQGLAMLLGGASEGALRELTDLGHMIPQRTVRRAELTPFALPQGGGGLFSQGSPFMPLDNSGATVDTIERQPARRRRTTGGAITIT
jgi:hypothetical protein